MNDMSLEMVHLISVQAQQLANDSNAVTMIGLALLLVIAPVLLITLSDLPWKPAKKRERRFIERF
jgi:hypothetical protein